MRAERHNVDKGANSAAKLSRNRIPAYRCAMTGKIAELRLTKKAAENRAEPIFCGWEERLAAQSTSEDLASWKLPLCQDQRQDHRHKTHAAYRMTAITLI
jgi:hypothetical protein